MSRRALTLIELLIVVAIIAILAAIAIPNFLEAQVRAKVSAAKSDLRTIATALEAYAVDACNYPPNDGRYNEVPDELTTPVAYITSSDLVDPFARQTQRKITSWSIESPLYTYMKIVTWDEAAYWTSRGRPVPHEAIDHWARNKGAFEKYGPWRLVSVGPDRKYLSLSFPMPVRGSDIPYDPTNGTVSFGNILRTHEGRVPVTDPSGPPANKMIIRYETGT